MLYLYCSEGNIKKGGVNMRIRTAEDDFEFQVKEMLNKFKHLTEKENITDEDLWNNKEMLGEILYDKMWEVLGFDTLNVTEI